MLKLLDYFLSDVLNNTNYKYLLYNRFFKSEQRDKKRLKIKKFIRVRYIKVQEVKFKKSLIVIDIKSL